MKTRVERLPDHPARVLLEVEVDAARVEEAIDQVYRKVVRNLRIPGFRPGRAPRKIVEMHVGKEYLLQEAVDELIPQLYREAARKEQIDPVDRASIDIVDMGVDQPLKFTAEVDVRPDVTLGQYEGIKAERRLRKVDDASVERMVESVRQQMAQLVNVEKDALEEGDFAIIDFEGFMNGEPFQGGAARGQTIEIGAGAFVPGFEEQLVGMAPGEEREIEITFPEDYREDLAGKPATFRVKLHEIKERRVPDLDDEFAKDTGQFDTLEEMRADFRRRLEETAAEQADEQLRVAVLKQVADDAQVDIPQVMIEQEIEQMQREMQLNLAQSGIGWEHFLQMSELTEEEWREQVRDDAELRVKQDLVLLAVGGAQNLHPDEDAVDERLRELFAGRDEKELKTILADEDRRDVVRENLLRTRALDWLVEHAQVTEVEYEPETEDDNDAEETPADTSETATGAEEETARTEAEGADGSGAE